MDAPNKPYNATPTGRIFVEPNQHDVLCGRGKDCFHHEGNVLFRGIIEKMLPQYTMSNSKKHKMQIIKFVVNFVVDSGGRFLKKDMRRKEWYDGGIMCGKDKVGHSFRDAKGQGRRKSSKVLRNLNKGESQVEAVAALSEENRGAVVLAAFKMGHTVPTPSLTLSDTSSSNSSTHAKEEEEVSDAHAASSLLFLQRAMSGRFLEDTTVHAACKSDAVDYSTGEAQQPPPAIHQSCAAFVPMQPGGKANSYYFI